MASTLFLVPPIWAFSCSTSGAMRGPRGGGVLAQLAVAVPLILWSVVFGFTAIGVVNATIAVFGYLSFLWVVLNLMPVARLDGAIAWQIVPYLWRRRTWFRSRTTAAPVDAKKRIDGKGGWVH